MWLLQLLLKAAIFFTLFAFALNNQHEAVVHFFFGTTWQAPLVLVVLAAFILGVAIGVLGMVPRWWKHRRLVQHAHTLNTEASAKSEAAIPTSADTPHGI
jgi:putative membrane protein